MDVIRQIKRLINEAIKQSQEIVVVTTKQLAAIAARCPKRKHPTLVKLDCVVERYAYELVENLAAYDSSSVEVSSASELEDKLLLGCSGWKEYAERYILDSPEEFAELIKPKSIDSRVETASEAQGRFVSKAAWWLISHVDGISVRGAFVEEGDAQTRFNGSPYPYGTTGRLTRS